MEVLLGAISSLLYGVADFIGGEGARKVTAATFVLWAAVFSFPALVLTSVLVGGFADAPDYFFGILAGFLESWPGCPVRWGSCCCLPGWPMEELPWSPRSRPRSAR